MKTTQHVCFFYNEERVPYLNRIIEATNNYPFYTDIYIHCNKVFPIELLTQPTNGGLFLIGHNIIGNEPWVFPEYVRKLMKVQKDAYDYFLYNEDDVLVPPQAIHYWLKNKDEVLKENYNLGFIRIEIDSTGEEFSCDLHNDQCICQQLNKCCNINNKLYVINDVNPHAGFWIYDKQEFNRFVESKWWNPRVIKGYGLCEQLGIGLHFIRDPEFKWYKDTVIPLTSELTLVNECKVYHLPNKYIKMPNCFFSTVRFDEILPLTQDQVLHPNFAIQRKHSRL